jgi:hypothetical protein
VETKDWEGREKEKRIKGYEAWAFDSHDHTIHVSFSKAENPYAQFYEPPDPTAKAKGFPTKTRDAVSNIRCYSKETFRKYTCSTIGEIGIGDSETEVNRTLGPPTRSRIDGVNKILTYDDTGVTHVLTKERVYGLSIGTPAAETNR